VVATRIAARYFAIEAMKTKAPAPFTLPEQQQEVRCLPFLRCLLPRAGAPSTVDARADELARQLDELPGLDPIEAARLLAAQIGRMRSDIVSGAREPPRIADAVRRLERLDALRERAEQVLPQLEEPLSDPSLPLSEAQSRTYAAAEQLLGELAGEYAELAAAMASRRAMRSAAGALRPPLMQAMSFCARRLALRHRIYANGNDPGWLDLHRLYRMARDAGFADALLGGDQTPGRIYLQALLLAFAEPTRLQPGEIDQVRDYLARYGHLAEIAPAGSADRRDAETGCFLVQPAEARPGRSLRKWRLDRIGPDDLIVRCAPLARRLEAHVEGLERDVAPPMLGLPKRAADPRYLHMLRGLHAQWGSPASRRHKRVQSYPRSDLLAGFDSIWSHLSVRPAEGWPAQSSTPAPGTEEISEWALHNESPEGYGLAYLGGNTRRLRVGELILIHPRGLPGGQVCAVRRMINRETEGLELGVQVIAPRAIAATVTLRAPEESTGGRRERVLVLPAMPGQNNASGIVAPIGAVSTGTRFPAMSRGEPTVLRVGRRLERFASCELFTLEQAAV
jgi:hypothetical protein